MSDKTMADVQREMNAALNEVGRDLPGAQSSEYARGWDACLVHLGVGLNERPVCRRCESALKVPSYCGRCVEAIHQADGGGSPPDSGPSVAEVAADVIATGHGFMTGGFAMGSGTPNSRPLPKPDDTCPKCNGAGYPLHPLHGSCAACGGTGRVTSKDVVHDFAQVQHDDPERQNPWRNAFGIAPEFPEETDPYAHCKFCGTKTEECDVTRPCMPGKTHTFGPTLRPRASAWEAFDTALDRAHGTKLRTSEARPCAQENCEATVVDGNAKCLRHRSSDARRPAIECDHTWDLCYVCDHCGEKQSDVGVPRQARPAGISSGAGLILSDFADGKITELQRDSLLKSHLAGVFGLRSGDSEGPSERCEFVGVVHPAAAQRCWNAVGHEGPHNMKLRTYEDPHVTAMRLAEENAELKMQLEKVRSEAQRANVGAGGGDEDGYNVVDGREAVATRTFIVAWLRNKERFRAGTGWATNEEIARLIESGDDGELPWGRDDA